MNNITKRPRRLRSSDAIRSLVAQTEISVNDLIQPLFVVEGENQRQIIPNIPNVFRLSCDLLVQKVQQLYALGIKAVALFPAIAADLKNANGTESLNENGLVIRAIRAIKSAVPQMLIIADVALDPYTSHGHDGILNTQQNDVDNDATVQLLSEQALLLAKAGADIVAPSDMMDGRVAHIRQTLNNNGYASIIILSYAIKYASSLYSPFRQAVQSQDNFLGKTKQTYQMDYRNLSEAFIEATLDENESADILMVKPALFYLDIISKISQQTHLPVFAYQVSGEYAMIKNAAENGIVNYEKTIYESLIAIKRSGARCILTYAAEDIAKMLLD
jgi:porphobilinogen synthase